MEKVKTRFWFFALMISAAGFFWFLSGAIEVMQRVDCLEMQKQAREFEDFFLTPTQKTQCDSVGVKINAPVRRGMIL